MKKYNSNSVSFKHKFAFAFMIILISGISLIAQDQRPVVVSYNSPFSFSLGEDVSWELKDENGSLLNRKSGDVSEEVFSKPGSYTLHIKEEHKHTGGGCDHAHLPESITIDVKPVKINFDFSTIRFSKDIKGGQSSDGTIVSVNVNFASYDNSTAVYSQDLTSFGVGSSIAGKLKNETILKPGVNTVEFVLEGQAEMGNNIQLNFIDFNGEVQPYTLSPKF